MTHRLSSLMFLATLVGFSLPSTAKAEDRGAGAADAYPRPDLLIEPAQLAAAADTRKDSVVLDARDRRKYADGHVPGARSVDNAAWAKAFGHGEDVEGWAKRIGDMGIGRDTKVVVYDDGPAKDAARIWWLLRYWGVADVRLLNGGWAAWQAGGHPVDKAEPPRPAAVKFVPEPRTERLATKEQLLESLQRGGLQVVDARSEGEFCGTDQRDNKRAGAVPGARQLEWSDLLDEETHRFKPAAELRDLFAQAGVELDKPTATHCQSGGRSSVMAFAMELMGAVRVGNYYAGWGEWGNAEDTPVVPGTPKGQPPKTEETK